MPAMYMEQEKNKEKSHRFIRSLMKAALDKEYNVTLCTVDQLFVNSL